MTVQKKSTGNPPSLPPFRCPWAKGDLYELYHDFERGVPLHDDRSLFEFLILEGAQAGLSWETVLKKRENYRAAFDRFDAERIAKYSDQKCAKLLENPGIIRNRLKVQSAVLNARAYLDICADFGGFGSFIWQFVDGKPIRNCWKTMADVPSSTAASDAMSKELKRRGFKFVGTTICYAFMQATGMVNDHLVDCVRYRQVALRHAVHPS